MRKYPWEKLLTKHRNAKSARGRQRYAWLAVNAFNDAHGIGTSVTYWTGTRAGEGAQGRTRSAADVLSGTPVVWVHECIACISLTHIKVSP